MPDWGRTYARRDPGWSRWKRELAQPWTRPTRDETEAERQLSTCPCWREAAPLCAACVQAQQTLARKDGAAEEETYTTEEHCQFCGNRWTQTRTLGTPRLDAVPCPSCARLV